MSPIRAPSRSAASDSASRCSPLATPIYKTFRQGGGVACKLRGADAGWERVFVHGGARLAALHDKVQLRASTPGDSGHRGAETSNTLQTPTASKIKGGSRETHLVLSPGMPPRAPTSASKRRSRIAYSRPNNPAH
jgi:hypothetical protein